MRWGQGGKPGLVLHPYLILQKWGKTHQRGQNRHNRTLGGLVFLVWSDDEALVTVRSSQARLCVQDYDSRLHTEGLS